MAKRVRSPSYPVVDLQEALRLAGLLNDEEGKAPVPVSVAVTHWGYKVPEGDNNPSGPAGRKVAALKKYGLVIDEGSGEGRSIRLTELALDLILYPEDEPRRKEWLRTAALNPAIIADIWAECPDGRLPSDKNLIVKLAREREFTKKAAEDFIPKFRSTISYANLENNSSISQDDGDKNSGKEGGITPIKGSRKPKVTPPSTNPEALRIPIQAGGHTEWINIDGSFPITENRWDQFMTILQAMKPGLVVSNQPEAPDEDYDEQPE